MSNLEKNFLDYNGLSHYDEKIKEYIPIIHGYYNDGNFYSDSSFTELITGEEKKLYVDLVENGLYEYKNNEYIPFSGGGGTTNYNNLSNKPQINSVELSGNKSLNDLGIAADNHTHSIDLAADSGTSELDLSADTKYKLSAGGESFVFKTPPIPSASDVGAIASSTKGTANGVAELDANGFVPSAQLPSFVDDIIEGYLYDGKFYKESTHTTEITGETGKVYVDLTTDTTYRWSGTAFVQIKGDLALGETSSTAYRGDRGKIAYDHSQSTHARTDATKTEASATNGNIKINGTETTVYTHPGSGTNPHGTTASDVGLGNVGNFKAVSTVASQGLTDTEKSNARANIGAGTSSLTIGSTASTAAAGNHTHGLSLATDTGTSSISLAANTKYKLTAGGSTYIFTTPPDNNTTYESKSAASGGTAVSLCTTGEKYTWNNKSNLAIGTTGTTAAAGNHTHTTSLATDSGTPTVTLARNTTYKLTAGGTNVIFKTPASDNTDTKNTAGSTDTSSKIFLIGATSQAANPQTYSDNEVYATNGVLTTKSVQVGGTAATMQYNSTNKCIDFVFA